MLRKHFFVLLHFRTTADITISCWRFSVDVSNTCSSLQLYRPGLSRCGSSRKDWRQLFSILTSYSVGVLFPKSDVESTCLVVISFPGFNFRLYIWAVNLFRSNQACRNLQPLYRSFCCGHMGKEADRVTKRGGVGE